MFYQIPEEGNENCEKTILDFVEQQLKIENAFTDKKLHIVHSTYIIAKFS